MESLRQDLRYAIRTWLRSPFFTGIAILAMALGIGANTAIFSVVNTILLRPLPYPNAERLVRIWETEAELAKAPITPADFLDWKQQSQSFEQLAAFRSQSFNVAGGQEPERIRGARVSANFFLLLGVQPALGRSFTEDEDQPGHNQLLVLSDELWRRRFGADPHIIGTTLLVNDRSYAVIGITPRGATFPTKQAEMWTPNAFSEAEKKTRRTHYISAIGRLKPNVTLAQAQAEMTGIASRLEQQYPTSNSKVGVKVVSLKEEVVGNVQPVLMILLVTVICVLLIACGNVANLLLARAVTRQKEIAVRNALGASRLRIIRQMLTESILLSFAGGALGLILAFVGIYLLVELKPTNIPRLTEIHLDARALAFTFFISVLTGLFFGIFPALHASTPDLNESLKEGARYHSPGPGQYRLRNLLVVGEVALSLVLLIGAGLLIKSFLRLRSVDLGFDQHNLLTMEIALPPSKYADSQKQVAFFQQALEAVKSMPGVQQVAAISDMPLLGGNSTIFQVEGRPVMNQGEKPLTEYRLISADYFQAMSIPLLEGRFFTERDNKAASGVVIINQTLAKRFFPGQDPVGKRLGLSDPPDWREIVGVVRDVRDYGPDTEPNPECYMPFLQNAPDYIAGTTSSMALIVHAAVPVSLTPAVRHQIHTLDKDQPINNLRTMEDLLAETVAQRRFNMLLLSIFAALALLLAAVGVYGVINYSVTQRTHEFGVRMALGAEPLDVIKLVLSQGMKLAATGIVLGLVVAFAITRTLSSLLYGVTATDPAVFLLVSLLMAAIALLASYHPARKATKLDPVIALGTE